MPTQCVQTRISLFSTTILAVVEKSLITTQSRYLSLHVIYRSNHLMFCRITVSGSISIYIHVKKSGMVPCFYVYSYPYCASI